jgi:adenine deaminase
VSAAQKKALRWVGRASEKAKLASGYRDSMIRDALEEGCSIREVAAAANLSPARVHQIRHGK